MSLFYMRDHGSIYGVRMRHFHGRSSLIRAMAFNEGILANQRPNIFELLEEEAMHETLRPAVEYVCKVQSQKSIQHTKPTFTL